MIVTEYAAFPLRLINGLEQLKNHYIRSKNLNFLLHNDHRCLFTDIIPPNIGILESLQEIFYPCLAFELIRQNQETGQLEFNYYDELRGQHYLASLSPSWNQALEELANRADMAAALKQLFDKEIANIERQPTRWEEYYLIKLRQFINRVDRLPEDNINYLYRSRVVGTLSTANTLAKEGILNRFLKKMQKQVETLNPNTRVLTASQEPIKGEIVAEIASDEIFSNLDSFSLGDNLAKRRKEIGQLKQDLDDNIITQQEYDAELRVILNRYPLR